MPFLMSGRNSLASAITAMFALLGCATENTSTAGDSTSNLEALVEDILNEPIPAERDRKAGHLYARVREAAAIGGASEVSEVTIDGLITMLSDPATNLVACATLAEIGPRATRAVPAVEAAIARIAASEASTAATTHMSSPVPTIARMQNCLDRLRRRR